MKAVILAGGYGSRLRPMTCNIPKPMVRVLGKPIIEYIFELLISNGITEASITLGYLPHIIENAYSHGYKNLKLNFIREESPLGTAGSVRNAALHFDEPFIVISGDAICNFELRKIAEYHRASGAQITIVGKTEPDPREFGLLRLGNENRVVGFIEKPSWNQALTTLANTGVYVVNPECLELIPENKSFDFASDLFPLMLENDLPIYCYHTEDYWCDVGNPEAFLSVQKAVFDGEIKFFSGKIADGIYASDEMPKGDYSIVPPVYFGRNVEVSSGAVIGPYTVIDDNCFVGKNSKIRHSVILENVSISRDVSVTGAIVCSGAALKSGASVFEGSVAGSGCIIGENAAVNPNVSVWPGKLVGKETKVIANLKYGNLWADCITENGINEESGTRLNSSMCVRLGAAIGSTRNGKRTGISNDGSKTAKMMQSAITAGILGSGGSVWDFGEGFESRLNFLVNRCGMSAGIFIKGGENREIRICGEGGLSIPRFFERSLESLMVKGEFNESSEAEMKENNAVSGVGMLYFQELLAQAPYGLKGVNVTVESENGFIHSVMQSALKKLCAGESDDFIITVDSSGTKAEATLFGEKIGYEKLLALCCLNEIQCGKDIAVPYDSPPFLDELATAYGRKAYRYLTTPADNSDSLARRLASKQIFVRDGLFLALRILSIIKERECTVTELFSALPNKFILRKKIPIGFSPAELAGLIGEESVETVEGVKLIRSKGKLIVIPDKSGESVKVLAEADTMEAANELFYEIEDILKTFNQ